MSRTIEAIIKPTGATSEKKSASATSQTMKAIRIHNYGGPKVLHYEDAPRPKPQAGEVLVRVHAAGVNPIDWKVRDRKSTRLNSSHGYISYAVFCLKKKTIAT